MNRSCWMVALLALACSEESSEPGGSAGSAGSAGSDGGAGAAGTCSVPIGPDAAVPMPTASDIQFSVTNPLPKGEQILFNDWNPSPNTLSSIRPDGGGEIEVLRAYRLWSLAASHGGTKLAFACGDPQQEQNYGITIGDAIQHTWLYDIPSAEPSVLAWGNLNDECHTFSAADDALWICRRWDFASDGSSQGYQIARLTLGCGEVELPTAPSDDQLELHPAPSADESSIHYTLIEIAAGKQTRRIVKKALPGGAVEVVRESATLESISPDGTRLVFADHLLSGALFVMNLDGSNLVQVSSHAGTNAVWSPDGTRIAYLWDETSVCHHIETVAADGSEASSPVRVRDCGAAFITALAWLTVP